MGSSFVNLVKVFLLPATYVHIPSASARGLAGWWKIKEITLLTPDAAMKLSAAPIHTYLPTYVVPYTTSIRVKEN